jgi:hypothetical protein
MTTDAANILITMTAYRRPKYTRQVLDALSLCYGIHRCRLEIHVEPGDDEVRAIVESFDACETVRIFNRKRRGLNRNTFDAVSAARRLKPSLLVHLEDDTVPSPDCLEYFQWVASEVFPVDTKLRFPIISGYNRDVPTDEQANVCSPRNIWTPWGWAVDRARLSWLLVNWCFKNPKCFTCRIKDDFKQTRWEVYPALSRIQNIGYEKGENNRTPAWYRENHRSPAVANESHRGDFRLDERIHPFSRFECRL